MVVDAGREWKSVQEELRKVDVTRGGLPRRAHALVVEWASLHRAELKNDWERARLEKPLEEIEGLE